MISDDVKYPFFKLLKNSDQAESALSVLIAFGSKKEKTHLKPEAVRLRNDFIHNQGQACLMTAINNLLAAYLEMYGEFSDEMTIFLSKSLCNQADKAAA